MILLTAEILDFLTRWVGHSLVDIEDAQHLIDNPEDAIDGWLEMHNFWRSSLGQQIISECTMAIDEAFNTSQVGIEFKSLYFEQQINLIVALFETRYIDSADNLAHLLERIEDLGLDFDDEKFWDKHNPELSALWQSDQLDIIFNNLYLRLVGAEAST